MSNERSAIHRPGSLIDIQASDRAILVSLEREGTDWESSLEEMKALADTAGVEVAGVFTQRRHRPDQSLYLGSGKAEELYTYIRAEDANTVIVNDELVPTQQRNLEDAVAVRVIDRTQLILDIFAQRAHTKEGKLQVEVAQIQYMLPRLVGIGKELSDQGGAAAMGGGGARGPVGARGPGETQLETDRARIRRRLTELRRDLDEVRKQRRQQRQGRRKLPYPVAVLVGYTSAGKSTLLNRLTGSDVLVDAKLFATLDPTTRRVDLPEGWGVLLTDTVGFIRELPHSLVAAFRAMDLGDPRAFYDAIVTAGFPVRPGEAGTLGELSPKPHPWLYAEAARVGLGIPFDQRHRVVGIEDSGAGVCAIRLAGFTAFGMAGGTIEASGARPLCQHYCASFDEVLAILHGSV